MSFWQIRNQIGYSSGAVLVCDSLSLNPRKALALKVVRIESGI